MILIDILKKIFRKKKKAVAPTPPIVVTPPKPIDPPKPIEPLKPKIDPLTGEIIDENEIIQAKAIENFNRGLLLLERQKEAYVNLFRTIQLNTSRDINQKAPSWQIDQHRNEEKTLLDAQNLDTKKAAKMCIDAYKLMTDYFTKIQAKQKYDVLRTFFTNKQLYFNIALYDVLSNIGYQLVAPVNPIEIIKDSPVETTTGGNTPKNPSQADLYTRANQIGTIYPQWQNKDYLTSEYVIYNGLTYKNGAQVFGNNNNTPDKDYRWIRV